MMMQSKARLVPGHISAVLALVTADGRTCECVVRCNGIDAAALNRHIPLPGDRATGKTQHERKSQLVTDTGDDDGDDDGAVGLDEPADTEVRGQKRDFEA